MMESSKQSIKILQIPSGGLYCDGIYNCITSYLDSMERSGIEVSILTYNFPNEAIMRRFKQFGCDVLISSNRKRKPISYFCFLLSHMKQYDIVEVHGSSSIMAVELLAAKLCGCKVRIAHSHNTTCDHKYLHKLFLPLFRAVYTDAFACGRDAGKWLFGEMPFVVIPNGRSFQQFAYSDQARKEIRCQYGLENDIVIGHVGGFNFQKNHEFLIDVFAEILKIKKNVKLVLMGAGGLIQNIREKVSQLGIEEQVVFAGQVDNMAEMLSAMDIMMLPSRHEGLPLVVLEWQISGLPCLISNKVTKECKATNLVSFLPIDEGVKPWVEAFGKTVIAERRDKISNAACIEMKQAHFDIEENAENLRKLYFDVASR